MKILISIICFAYSTHLVGQINNPQCYCPADSSYASDSSACTSYGLSLGPKYFGLGLGSFGKYNGINLSITDNTCKFNGLGISVIGNGNSIKKSNGIDIGIIPVSANNNGITLGIIWGEVSEKMNGIGLFGIAGDVWKMNGISIAGIAQLNDVANGLSVAGIDLTSYNQNGVGISLIVQRIDSVANGVSIAGLSYSAEKTNGLSIAPFNKNESSNGVQIGLINISGQSNGVQFGLINVIKENRRLFRFTPFINFNFKRNQPLRIKTDTVTPENDTLLCIKTYNPNRNIISKYLFNGNKFEGIQTQYYKNGCIRTEKNYTNGILTGNAREYYKNGHIQTERNYTNGILNGYAKEYYKNGQLMSEMKYKNGELSENYWIFDKKGNKKFYVVIN